MSCGERASEAHWVSHEGARSVGTRESWQAQVQGRPLRRASERAKLAAGAWVSRDDEGIQAGAGSGEATLFCIILTTEIILLHLGREGATDREGDQRGTESLLARAAPPFESILLADQFRAGFEIVFQIMISSVSDLGLSFSRF